MRGGERFLEELLLGAAIQVLYPAVLCVVLSVVGQTVR